MAWWSAKLAAVESFASRNTEAAVAIAPEHPEPRMALATRGLDLQQGPGDQQAARTAIAAMADAPLAEEPFLLAAADRIGAGRQADAMPLLQEAKRRNPRSRPARFLLLDAHLRAGRIQEAVAEISALRRLVPDIAGVLVTQTSWIVQNRGAAAALRSALERDPQLQQEVLAELVESGADPNLILSMAPESPPPGAGTATQWQRDLVQRLAAGGNLRLALTLWRRFANVPGEDTSKGIHDGRFEREPAMPPFGWQLAAEGGGVAERVSGPALEVEYHGRQQVDLAKQLLMLEPGRYELRLRADGNATSEGALLRWQIGCQGSSAQLLSLPVATARSGAQELRGSFSVPGQGCQGQWLVLKGVPGEFPEPQRAKIWDLQIQRVRG